MKYSDMLFKNKKMSEWLSEMSLDDVSEFYHINGVVQIIRVKNILYHQNDEITTYYSQDSAKLGFNATINYLEKYV